MDDPLTWLRAQLDRRAQLARAASGDGSEWRYDDSGIYPSDESRHPGPIIVGPYGYLMEEHGEHVAENDPATVLAEVEADRRILDLHDRDHECSVYDPHQGPPEVDNCAWVLKGEACSTVRLLALRFAHMPGYRDEWRP